MLQGKKKLRVGGNKPSSSKRREWNQYKGHSLTYKNWWHIHSTKSMFFKKFLTDILNMMQYRGRDSSIYTVWKIKAKEEIIFCVLRTLYHTFFIKRMVWTVSLLKWKDVRCQHPSSLCDIKCKKKSSILKFASPHKTSVFMARIRYTFLPLSILYKALKYLVLWFMTECFF